MSNSASSSPTYDEFAAWVHDALNRLYDSPYLEAHPLADALVGAAESTRRRSQNVRQMVIETIRAMRPAPGAPARSPDWRAYRILELRYLDGLSPTEVMAELALGRSRYFQEQARVLEAFTQRLWDVWQATHESPAPLSDEDTADSRQELAYLEAERLTAHATWESLTLSWALADVQAIVEPMAQTKGVTISFQPPSPDVAVRGDRIVVRQVLLNLLSYALDRTARGAAIALRGFSRGQEVGLALTAGSTHAAPAPDQRPHAVGLDVCRHLMAAMGGSLHLHTRPGAGVMARLVWPRPADSVLLVIDDNEDFVELFRRYVADHRWRVVGATTGAAARKLLAEMEATVITLDVMMPQEDGWDILRALQTDDRTQNIPVIICSVLNEPRLAQALGAADYLTKPVSQEALLQALARLDPDAASQAPAH